MSAPQRIQLSRKKGWRMPPNTVKVDRTTAWGNPFKVLDSNPESVVLAIGYFRRWLEGGTESFECGPHVGVAMARIPHWSEAGRIRDGAKKHLRGKNLACWCRAGAPCHADVLLEIANRDESEGAK